MELSDKVLSFPVDLGLELVVGTRAMVQMTKKLFWLRQSLGPPSPNTIRSQYVQIDKLGGRASNCTCTRNIVCSDSVSHLAYAKMEVHFRRHPAGQTSDLRSCHPCRACPSVLEDMSRREGPCNDHRFTSDRRAILLLQRWIQGLGQPPAPFSHSTRLSPIPS